ncbi:hypothetical protein Halru_1965 [Halovivax ruber XH-70]|uniref:Zinc-ribbon domain-containing protein n=1 Tax=Halovivax ruber (strain DSM 18193 / JCM 13892 / XH-70) TaxID=797302 RepID=L0IF07_HALRX|nr:zinc ribbon domain-containing protein [Halovivax ruber]AGB16562.1 hypothetical protein Halru_1965 [Halovivax ruber XH-70]
MAKKSPNANCYQCGKALEETAQFCPNCGADQTVSRTDQANTERKSGSNEGEAEIRNDGSSSSKEKKITIGRILAWIIAPLVILVGLAMIQTDPVAGAIVVAVGIFALPTTRGRIREDYDLTFSRWVVLGVVVIGLAIAGGLVGQDGVEPESNVDDAGPSAAEAEPATDDTVTDAEEGVEGNQIRVRYDGEWSGAIGEEGATRSVDGNGDDTLDVADDAMIISATIQKEDDSNTELTVQILEDGEVVAEQSTTSEFGVVSVTHGP